MVIEFRFTEGSVDQLKVDVILGSRLELLRELVSILRPVAVLSCPPHPTNAVQLKGAHDAARALGMQLDPVPVRGPNDFDAAFKAVRSADGLLCLDILLFVTYRARPEASYRPVHTFRSCTGAPPPTSTRS